MRQHLRICNYRQKHMFLNYSFNVCRFDIFSQGPWGYGEHSSVRKTHMHAHTRARAHRQQHWKLQSCEWQPPRGGWSLPVAGSAILRVPFFVSDPQLLL